MFLSIGMIICTGVTNVSKMELKQAEMLVLIISISHMDHNETFHEKNKLHRISRNLYWIIIFGLVRLSKG